jgi:exopolysaccharide biosynthesis WecB/TagA/CpsF family protein
MRSTLSYPLTPILNISVHNLGFHEFLENLQEGVVFTPNLDHLVRLQHDKQFYNAYQKSDYRVCDSRILVNLSKAGIIGEIKEQIAGSDLLPAFYHFHKNNPSRKIFLLGGRTPASTTKAISSINRKTNSNIVTGGYSPPFGFEFDQLECDNIIDLINASGANVLAVGVGSPKQELWIIKHRERLPNIKIFLAIGAAIDFESGILMRSPKILTRLGLEWCFRIWQEPARLWKRYLLEDLPVFRLFFLQKIGRYKNPWGESDIKEVVAKPLTVHERA